VAVNGVCHRLEPIVSSEFLIDVVEMIAQRLRTDAEPLRFPRRLGHTHDLNGMLDSC